MIGLLLVALRRGLARHTIAGMRSLRRLGDIDVVHLDITHLYDRELSLIVERGLAPKLQALAAKGGRATFKRNSPLSSSNCHSFSVLANNLSRSAAT